MTFQEALDALRQGKRVRRSRQRDGSNYQLQQKTASWILVGGAWQKHQRIFVVTPTNESAEAVFTKDDEAATDWQEL
jgi:hypothetical protein